MHLKCNSGDIKQKNTFFSNNVKPHNNDSNTKLSFFPINSPKTPEPIENETISGGNMASSSNIVNDNSGSSCCNDSNKNEIHKKIRELAISFIQIQVQEISVFLVLI